jgi:hypothetical protein
VSRVSLTAWAASRPVVATVVRAVVVCEAAEAAEAMMLERVRASWVGRRSLGGGQIGSGGELAVAGWGAVVAREVVGTGSGAGVGIGLIGVGSGVGVGIGAGCVGELVGEGCGGLAGVG